jgi:hypothetical protein
MRFEVSFGEQVSPNIFSYAPLFISFIAVGISLWVVWKGNKKDRNEGTYNFNQSWQTFNHLVVSEKTFLEIECALHPHGDLTLEEMKRVYFWFLRFNVSYMAHRESTHQSMRKALAKSALNNEANLSYPDRKFIKTHVFTRGYDSDFTKKFCDLWDEIEDNNQVLSMRGADGSNLPAPRNQVSFGCATSDFYDEVEELSDTSEAGKSAARSEKSGVGDVPVSNGATKKDSPVTSSKS